MPELSREGFRDLAPGAFSGADGQVGTHRLIFRGDHELILQNDLDAGAFAALLAGCVGASLTLTQKTASGDRTAMPKYWILGFFNTTGVADLIDGICSSNKWLQA